MDKNIYEWEVLSEGGVALNQVGDRAVGGSDIIVPVGGMSTALVSACAGMVNGDSFVSVVDDYFDTGLDFGDLKSGYPESRLMYISAVEYVPVDIGSEADGGVAEAAESVIYQLGFNNLAEEQGESLPGEWTGKRIGRSNVRITVSVYDGKDGTTKTFAKGVPVDFLVWFCGNGRFEFYVSVDCEKRDADVRWFPDFISQMFGLLDSQDDSGEWFESFVNYETGYHYRDFARLLRGSGGVPPEVLVYLCRQIGAEREDLERAISVFE